MLTSHKPTSNAPTASSMSSTPSSCPRKHSTTPMRGGALKRPLESSREMADHRILGASKLTGLTPDTIRKWERRYGVVDPRRDVRGIRRYSEADINRLRELRSATDLGYPIGEAALLKPEELSALLRANSAPAPTFRTGLRSRRPDSFTRAVLSGLRRYDGEQVDRMLAAASHLLTPTEFVFDVMSPLFHDIGEAWRKGTMEI